MRLSRRIADLESRLDPPRPKVWLRIVQDESQTREAAVAAYEAEHGPVGDRGVILRVIV